MDTATPAQLKRIAELEKRIAELEERKADTARAYRALVYYLRSVYPG